MFAARNIRLCNKDCVCLFVCPTGATDTENGQIDSAKCLDGCRLCVDSCPSHAIYLVYSDYPEGKKTDETVLSDLVNLLVSKSACGLDALLENKNAEGKTRKLIFSALARSCRILGEDCAREAGLMLPRSRTLEALRKDDTVSKLYADSYPGDNGETLQEILSILSAAASGGKDADNLAVYICGNCGHLSLGTLPELCSSCGSDKITGV